MKATSLLGLSLLVSSTVAFGAIIPIGVVPEAGGGLGSVNTVLTIQSPGNSTTESGCVSGAAGGAEGQQCPAGIPGGNNTGGNAGSNVYTAAQLDNLASFADLQIIFNAQEPQNGNEGITVSQLALTLWGSYGGILDAIYLDEPYVITDSFPGVGNAGYGFVLSGESITNANLLLAANPDLRIGLAATAIDAQGGIDTFSLRNGDTDGGGPGSEIPEPGTYALAASALAGLVAYRKFRRA